MRGYPSAGSLISPGAARHRVACAGSAGMVQARHTTLVSTRIQQSSRSATTRSLIEVRAEKRTVFYQDGTWFNKNMVPQKQWLDAEGRGGAVS